MSMIAFRRVLTAVSPLLQSQISGDRVLTGCSTALHFKLGIAKDNEGDYDNTVFQYTPRLDTNRDHDLIDLLPEYLTDEITFSRTNAAMFYGRVVNCLTKKRSVEVHD